MDLDQNIVLINHYYKNKIYENLNKPQPEFTLGIFLDLKKAFDNLDILQKKIEYNRFKNVATTWFQNYLVNRTRYVCINGTFSKEKTMFLRCSPGQYSWGWVPTISHIHKRFAFSNVFFN